DTAAITSSLNIEPEQVEHRNHGKGLRFRVGSDDEGVLLDLFPTASAARITTPDADITLSSLKPPHSFPGGIEFPGEQGDRVVFRSGFGIRWEVSLSLSGQPQAPEGTANTG